MKYLIVLLVVCCKGIVSHAHILLPQLVRDSMILQRDVRVKIWGWAAVGEKVTIRFNKAVLKTTTGKEGKWALWLPPTPAGGPYTIDISGTNRIKIKEVLFGDVWLCAGQSNMVHPVGRHRERYEKEIAAANFPRIRQFLVPGGTSLSGPQKDIGSSYWKWANPNDVLQFSAVAYFFAKTLYEKYQVPIGIINSSIGGPPIESWMSEESLEPFPDLKELITQNKDTAYVARVNTEASLQKASLPQPRDKGLLESPKWHHPAYVPRGWNSIAVPGYWEDQGAKDLDGIVWYRREVHLPKSVSGQPAKLALGRIVDADEVYINGTPIGNTGYQYPQRTYAVPPGILEEGRNLITVRVVNYSGKGGFVPDKPYYLVTAKDTFQLTGYWRYKVGDVFAKGQTTAPGIVAEYQPSSLFNAMIAPLANYTIKGFVWYQGEGNIGKPETYEKLLPLMIKDWRMKWGQADLPFLYVQLPGFGDQTFYPVESNLATLRQAQLKALTVPNTQMAVALDLGEWNDIHPGRKKEVGERLAIAAQHLAYGEKDITPTGPVYHSVSIEGNKMVITFLHTGKGLVTNDGAMPAEIAIAGADKKFVWAQAEIKGNTLVVWSPAVPHPVYVRYAWSDYPPNPNLQNAEGLPASPFEAVIQVTKPLQ